MSELYDILTETPPTKVVLLALDQGLWDCERSLAELSALCEANHMEAVAQITQKRQTPETGIVLGSGKLEEASLAAQTLGAECAVFDGELTGSQIRNISNTLGGLEVIDRTMLILEIFRSRAVTNEGKLQTELALLRYRLPRLQGMGESLSRQGGGGGGPCGTHHMAHGKRKYWQRHASFPLRRLSRPAGPPYWPGRSDTHGVFTGLPRKRNSDTHHAHGLHGPGHADRLSGTWRTQSHTRAKRLDGKDGPVLSDIRPDALALLHDARDDKKGNRQP